MEYDKEIKQTKKMIINFPENIHRRVKQLSAVRGSSMNMWILGAIQKRIMEEDKYLREPDGK